jgi:transcription initiation factor TFIIB
MILIYNLRLCKKMEDELWKLLSSFQLEKERGEEGGICDERLSLGNPKDKQIQKHDSKDELLSPSIMSEADTDTYEENNRVGGGGSDKVSNIGNQRYNAQEDKDESICVCGSNEYIIDESLYICKECATVLDRTIDCSAEWRYYGGGDTKEADPSRCGMPTNSLLPKSSLGSMISGFRSDNRDIRRIRMFQIWNSMPYQERTLLNVFDKIAINTAAYGISSKVLGDAKVLYKQASVKKISRGENKEGLIASCIYHACIINGVPRSTKEISKMFNINPMVLTKGNTRFQTLMQLNVKCVYAENYISRFGSILGMSRDEIEECSRLAKYLEDEEIISDNSATSSAAGIIHYYICNRNKEITKKNIGIVCGVSEVTITKCVKRIMVYDKIIKKHFEQDRN